MANHQQPCVLISCDLRTWEGYQWHAAIDTYIRSVALVSGCTPLLLPAIGDLVDIRAALDKVQGLVLTGARSNVHPTRYGQEAQERDEPFDAARDATTFPLIDAALDKGLPLFAICRGHQELNVAFGGTIDAEIQEMDGRFDHRGGLHGMPVEERFRLNHTIVPTPSGQLERMLGAGPVMVNSVHRQAAGKVGAGLTVEARAEDGTVEAISVDGARSFALGVQWHPEHWAAKGSEVDAPSTKLFKAFGEAVRSW